MRSSLASLAAVAASLALAGCGSAESSSAGNFQGQEKAVAEVVEDLQRAGQSRDAQAICSRILSPDLVKQIEEGGPCIDEVEKAIADSGEFELRVTDVTIQGDRATAKVQQGGDRARTATFPLVRVDGDWRVDSLG